MSHIAIDAREYTTSTGRYMFRLLQYLEKIDDRHDYTILLKPHDMDAYSFSNPRFRKLACPYKEFSFQEQLGLLRQLNQLRPDLVHFGKDHQPVLYRGQVVTTMHDLTTARFRNPAKPWLVFKTKQLVYKQVVRRVAHKSAAILTPTEFVKQDVVRYSRISPDKVTVTLEAADPINQPAVAVAGLEPGQFLMYVGRPTPHKNLGRLIEAYARLQPNYPQLQLALAGKEDVLYRQHRAAAKQQRVAGVVFTGFVTEGQLRWLYENCLAYVFPSLSEGFGLPGLEAMLHGAPVISSKATCLPEVYGRAAHYFDPLDTADMAGKIEQIITDAELRRQLIAAGYQQAAGYSWQRMARQTLDVYNRALAT